jgi:uncharacterized cupredoxin-like copper-binding protein
VKQQRHVLVSFLLGMLVIVLAACGGSSTSSSQTTSSSSAQNVQVTLSEFQITSALRQFSPGSSYHFVVTNKGKTNHEFMITPADMMPGMSMDQMHKMALAMIDTVAPGETKTVDVIFPQSDAGKSLELACHLPGHYEAGMKLGVKVSSEPR